MTQWLYISRSRHFNDCTSRFSFLRSGDMSMVLVIKIPGGFISLYHSRNLTYCGLVASYGDTDLGQYWLKLLPDCTKPLPNQCWPIIGKVEWNSLQGKDILQQSVAKIILKEPPLPSNYCVYTLNSYILFVRVKRWVSIECNHDEV